MAATRMSRDACGAELAAWRAAGSAGAVDARALLASALSGPPDDALLSYRVPKAAPDGGCSLPDVLEDAPVRLPELLAGAAAAGAPPGAPALEPGGGGAARLGALRAACAALAATAGVEWVGVYERVALRDGAPGAPAGAGDALVKVAYVGAPSRAVFPLTPAFARGSNNSLVGLSGDAVVVSDTRALGADDAYYACDGRVRSEFCLPVADARGAVVGIVDAEAWRPRAFDGAHTRALFLDAAEQLGASGFLRAWAPAPAAAAE